MKSATLPCFEEDDEREEEDEATSGCLELKNGNTKYGRIWRSSGGFLFFPWDECDIYICTCKEIHNNWKFVPSVVVTSVG
jgi:hypothetical protein